MDAPDLPLRSAHCCISFWVIVVASLALVNSLYAVDIGYRDFSYGLSGTSVPSGEKPESKLWWNDGYWWGSLYNDASRTYHIYRLDTASQSWVDTGTVLDNRPSSKADCLWDNVNQKLYVASHVFTTNGVPLPTSPSQWGRLYRLSYNPISHSYTLDSGFPVNVTRGKSETLVVDKDSTGKLWVTYVESQQVMVNRSVNGDQVWGDPFVLPVQKSETVNVTTDDISGLIAFGGSKIGLMWSNQLTSKMYFAVHLDGDADTIWQAEETALPGPNGTENSDDHINLKSLNSDRSGRVFAAIKTSLTSSSAPLVMLLARDLSQQWSSYVFGRVKEHHTRPIVLLDEDHARIFMFATAPESGGAIYYKTTDTNNISFPLGLGSPFIKTSADLRVNNPTSTRQNLNRSTGLVVLATDQDSRIYLHNTIDLSGKPAITSFTPTCAPSGTVVTITGIQFTGATAVSFNGKAATTFTVDSYTQIRATVPTGATTGKISVTTGLGTGVSQNSFAIPATPVVTSFSPTSGPVGTVVTITGNNFTCITSVAFNGTVSTFTVDSGTQIHATVPTGATTGRISVTNGAGTGASAPDFTVTP
ncbi:MAG: hypothetical protein DMG06_14570 [Acidobacteria bacterium]|nr:MAG: hypothetical protein DMG06_14570 [Acidobacteriota bacterium]